MENIDYENLRKEVIQLLGTSIEEVYKDDKEDIYNIDDNLLYPFTQLPNCESTVWVLEGIKGFYNHLTNDEQFNHSQFVHNSIHDIAECIHNGNEAWFCPRLIRFAPKKDQEQIQIPLSQFEDELLKMKVQIDEISTPNKFVSKATGYIGKKFYTWNARGQCFFFKTRVPEYDISFNI